MNQYENYKTVKLRGIPGKIELNPVAPKNSDQT